MAKINMRKRRENLFLFYFELAKSASSKSEVGKLGNNKI